MSSDAEEVLQAVVSTISQMEAAAVEAGDLIEASAYARVVDLLNGWDL